MKIYDCITYFNEKTLFELRLNILSKFIYRFIVVEATYTHSGSPKKLNFNINNYPKFKDRIIYIVLNDLPNNIKHPLKNYKRFNSIQRIAYQRDKILDSIKDANENDIIIYSDSDEIPNLNNLNFNKINQKFIIFKQKLFYYKLNLELKLMPWYGSRACKKKYLNNINHLRSLKPKKYSWWRFDTLIRKNKERSVKIINNGGWHFSQIMNSKQIQNKFLNDEHHDEYELNKLTDKKIKDMLKNKYIIYNHLADKKDLNKKWNNKIKLTLTNLNFLPTYIRNNFRKYKTLIAKK
jgi:beta-1,4-mannosyl-glycoprotein beta-1,4-N-acetylglucosaminyltransferase